MKKKYLEKTKIPTKKQIENLFVAIEEFKKNNIRYLLLPHERATKETLTPNIITTNNTNI